MTFDKVFVIVVVDNNNPELVKIQKLLFDKYDIKYAFVFESQPTGCVPSEHELFYTTPNPTIMFLKAIKELNLSGYTYVIRSKLSIYINFNQLSKIIEQLPTSHVASGFLEGVIISDWDAYNDTELIFINGAMILSSDTINYLKMYGETDRILTRHKNDDFVLSHILHRYARPFIHQGGMLLDGSSPYNYNDHTSMFPACFIAIIRYSNDQTNHDVWCDLLKRFDNIDCMLYR